MGDKVGPEKVIISQEGIEKCRTLFNFGQKQLWRLLISEKALPQILKRPKLFSNQCTR